jgi:hypothetical protein
VSANLICRLMALMVGLSYAAAPPFSAIALARAASASLTRQTLLASADEVIE